MLSFSWRVAILVASFLITTQGLYCGNKNCYEILEVNQTASKQDIKKAYRKLALEYHPDRVKAEDTTELFQQINQAYEILDNEFTRKEYDIYLGDPDGSGIEQYYRFYKAYYMPQANPIVVIFIFFLLLSALHYVMRKSMYETTIKNIMETDKFKRTVNQRWDGRRDKDDVRQELKEEIEIEGGLAPPKFSELFIVRVVLLPYHILKYIYGCARWTFLYRIRRLEYGQPEKQYLTKKALNISNVRWNYLGKQQQDSFISKQLWIAKNFTEFQQEQRKAQMQQLAGSNRYKKYVRFMKKNT